jgi:hypothetical protein
LMVSVFRITHLNRQFGNEYPQRLWNFSQQNQAPNFRGNRSFKIENLVGGES